MLHEIRSQLKFYLMKTINYLLALVICLVCTCCTNEEENFIPSDENQLNDPTRKVFATYEDFKDFCDQLQNNGPIVVDDTEQDIVSSFKQLTGLSELFNKKNEYQIGDTIYKLGDSGYTQYKIATESYQSAIPLINNEKKIIENLQAYNKIDKSTYEISNGILLTYTGKPIIEIEEITSDVPGTRINIQYDTKVTVSFWVAHGTNKITCGYKVSAVKESTGKAYSTQLVLEWRNVYIEIGLPNGRPETIALFNSGASEPNASSLSFTAYKRESLYADDLNINLVAGTIKGGAKAPNGEFVYATLQR